MPNQNTIPVTTALDWVTRWRASTETLPIKGFLVPGIDLTEVLAEEGVVNVRTYLGIDTNNEYHLLIVGVDDNGNDMLDEANGQYVYDFTEPCPPMCSATGVLR